MTSDIFDFAREGNLVELQDYKGDVNVLDNCKRTPLCYAIENNHIDCVKHLVDKLGAKVNGIANAVWRPLYCAAVCGRAECVKFLIDKGAIDDDCDAFKAAAARGFECMKYFAEQQGVNKSDRYGWRPIHSAAQWGQLSCIVYLVERGAHMTAVTTTTKDSYTPLSLAVWNGYLDCVKYLLSNGADPFNNIDDNIIGGYDMTLHQDEIKELIMKVRKSFKGRQAVQAMVSVKLHPRLGQKSSLQVFPTDLIRRLHSYFV
jgi:ankyrin repeat protein